MSNTGITLTDVRQEAFDTIKRLKSKEIDVKEAQVINQILGTVVDVAKTQVEFIKSLPASVKEKITPDEAKAMAGTLRDRDADLDLTMKEIADNNNKPYEVSK